MQELAAMQVTMLWEFRLPAGDRTARKKSLQPRQICEIREFLASAKHRPFLIFVLRAGHNLCLA
jgi:hypothetical protein